MINSKDNPIEWAGLMYELDDLKGHLESLIGEMDASGEISIEEYQVQIGHLYAHLNRAWNSRNKNTSELENDFEKLTEFPQDIETCG